MDNMSKHQSYDLYWGLNEDCGNVTTMRTKIQHRGYKMDVKQLKQEDLVKVLQREDRGLLCYDKYSNEELKTFATARKVPCYMDSNKSEQMLRLLREVTIQTLIEEDDDPHFDRFMDLPAEMRAEIYQYYSADFPKALYFPTKPPLARISRQIRQEMLPVFFSTHEFHVNIIRQRLNKPLFRASDETHMWLSQLSSADAANIKVLYASVGDRFRDGPVHTSVETVGTIRVEFNDNGWKGKIGVQAKFNHQCRILWTSAFKRRLLDKLDDYLSRDMLTPDGTRRCKLQNIYHIRRAVTEVYE